MQANHFDRLTRNWFAVGTRRRLLRVLAGVPLVGLLAAWLEEETEAGRRRRRERHQSRRDKNKSRVKSHGKRNKGKDNGRNKKNKDKKKDTSSCANAGQTPKKGRRCCDGLVKDGTGRCTQPIPLPDSSPRPCAETCAGCCLGETCITATNPQRCGSAGAACVSCAACKRCDAGQCAADDAKNGTCCNIGALAGACQSGNCVSDLCGPCTCPNGCCDGETCRVDIDTACGTGGGSCLDCTLSSKQCQTGQCVCVPLETCPDTMDCGEIDDGCGDVVPCGNCPDSSPICKDNNTCAPCANSAECGQNHLCRNGSCFACNVCDDPAACEESVQAAIDLAPAGGTVYICPGTYNETLTLSKNLTLIGAGSGDSVADTILDAQQTGRVLKVSVDHLNDPVTVEIQSMRIRGGDTALETESTEGGGIYNEGGSLTVRHCVVLQNHASSGGGIYTVDGMVSVANSAVQGNTADLSGGGIQNDFGVVALSGGSSVTGNDPDNCAGDGSYDDPDFACAP